MKTLFLKVRFEIIIIRLCFNVNKFLFDEKILIFITQDKNFIHIRRLLIDRFHKIAFFAAGLLDMVTREIYYRATFRTVSL